MKYGKYYNTLSNSMATGNAVTNFESIALLYNILSFRVNILVNFNLNTNVIKQFLSSNYVVSEGA